MYAKVYEAIFDSTLAEDYQVRHVFEDLLKLADQNGVVNRTPEAIARRTNVPLEIVSRALGELQKPDKQSQSKLHEGRRIILLEPDRDWGWQIVNHSYYRNLKTAEEKRHADKERQAKHRIGIDVPSGYVYYVMVPGSDVVKIGFSQNPWARLSELRISNPSLKIVAMEKGTFKTEKDRHRSYEHLRQDGEWFKITNELNTFIATLKQTCDVADENVTSAYAYTSASEERSAEERTSENQKASEVETLALEACRCYTATVNHSGSGIVRNVAELLRMNHTAVEMRKVFAWVKIGDRQYKPRTALALTDPDKFSGWANEASGGNLPPVKKKNHAI